MDFNIAFLDPNGFPGEQFGLNQTTDVIQKSLSACGHTTRISLNQLHKNAVNIIFDNYFTPEII